MRAFLLTLLATACGGAVSQPPETARPSEARPESASAATPEPGGSPTAPTASASPPVAGSSARLVLPADKGSGKFEGLQVDVVELVEKRKMDGSGMMRATLELRAAGQKETIELTSDDPKKTWNGYELEFEEGGWRSEVRLVVRRAPP